MHRACVRTALINEISTVTAPEVVLGVLPWHRVGRVGRVGSKYSVWRLTCGFSRKRRHGRTRGRPLDETSILLSHQW
jgi:hypothetical protein